MAAHIQWVAVRKTGNIYIRYSRVSISLPEIYSSISKAFHPAYAGETETG